MKMKDRTGLDLDANSIAKWLVGTMGEVEVERIARRTGWLRRKRDVTPMGMLTACLSTLGASQARWLADIHRTFNKQNNKSVQYKPFHNQLSKPEFPEFLHQVLMRVLENLTMPILQSLPAAKLSMFRDILIHDGSSFALKDALADKWPGRFTKVTPAAVELHVTMSVLEDKPFRILLAPDKESEQKFKIAAKDTKGRLLLEDRGYEHREFFRDVQKEEGFYIVRGKKNIRPRIRRAYDRRGRRIRRLEGKRLCWRILPQETVDLDIEWGKGRSFYQGRLVAIYERGKRNKKTFIYLHTNLDRRTFRIDDVATLYRLRWQIELLFKEWKSYANLHGFDTTKSAIAEGLIWASLIAATIKRFLAHAAEHVLGLEISTERVAATARHFLDEILSGLRRGRRRLPQILSELFDYFRDNARRAHPKRDRERGRLAMGLRPVATRQ